MIFFVTTIPVEITLQISYITKSNGCFHLLHYFENNDFLSAAKTYEDTFRYYTVHMHLHMHQILINKRIAYISLDPSNYLWSTVVTYINLFEFALFE